VHTEPGFAEDLFAALLVALVVQELIGAKGVLGTLEDEGIFTLEEQAV